MRVSFSRAVDSRSFGAWGRSRPWRRGLQIGISRIPMREPRNWCRKASRRESRTREPFRTLFSSLSGGFGVEWGIVVRGTWPSFDRWLGSFRSLQGD